VDLDDEKEIYGLHWSVESMMQAENAYYNRQWNLLVIEVKVMARGCKKCSYN
jgi:hypothetical protein